jgi:PrgI family protein
VSVKVPSDIDVADRLLWDLTARQVAILGITALCGLSLYAALGNSPAVVAAAEVIVIGTGAAFALARPDGVAAEQWLLAGMRHVRLPSRRVSAPEGLPQLPKWAHSKPVGELDFPVVDVIAAGIITLERNAFALVCRCSALNLALRSEEEQQALIEGFGRFLNSIDAALSLVVRSERSDLRQHIKAIEERAGALPHPALEEAARSHASFLASLAERRDVLRREVYLTLTTSANDPQEASRRLMTRVEGAASLLRAIGISLAVLDEDVAAALIARACKPGEALPLGGQAHPVDVVEGTTP